MEKMRKITVTVRRDHLDAAMEATGEGISETVRIVLRMLILEGRYPGLPTDDLVRLARQPLNS